jgi:apolipoprotein D and lipocalin family protein
MREAEDVKLDDFMGDWYVIANIPTFLEEGAHNALEQYALNEDGTVATTFSFNKDNFQGQRKTYTATGFVDPENTSQWKMQFLWPFKAEFIIAYLSPDYEHTIIARTSRDYVWIMARTPVISEQAYQQLIQISRELGYDINKIQKVPQKWLRSEVDQVLNYRYANTGHEVVL